MIMKVMYNEVITAGNPNYIYSLQHYTVSSSVISGTLNTVHAVPHSRLGHISENVTSEGISCLRLTNSCSRCINMF